MKTDSLLVSCLGLALCACVANDGSPASPTVSAAATSSAAASDDGSSPAAADAALTTQAEPLAEEPPVVPAEPPGPQPVRWRACGHVGDRDVSCAEVYVPLDHAQPAGEQIAISLNRISASRAHPARGRLLFNPGGPGESGKASVLNFIDQFDQLAPGFEIIGFDPRGIQDSGDRACAPAFAELLPYGRRQPRATSEIELLDEILAEAARCAEAWGPTFNELGSNQVVRDMDWLRQALGEPKLNFLGVSYGTRLGALYAHYFPDTTGAIVLDAVVTPDVDWLQEARDTFNEQSRLTEIVLSRCESGAVEGCPSNARQLFTDLVARARELGVLDQVMEDWIAGISSAAGGATLLAILQAQAATDGAWLEQIPPAPATAADVSGVMQLATVNCIDATVEPPTVAQLEALAAEFEATNPAFSNALLGATVCAGWPVTRDPVPLPTATGAPPLLVIGGAYDWRTPYPNAVAMTQVLGNARLLTSNHVGHGALLFGGQCAWSAMREFFTDGVLPPEGTVCDPNTTPPEPASLELLPSSLSSARPGLAAP